MNTKNILVGVGIIGTGIIGYKIGKTVAYIKSMKYGLDFIEEIVPGFKKMAVKIFSDKIIDSIFDEKEEKEIQRWVFFFFST